MLVVRWPLIDIATCWETPLRIMSRTAVRRRSWKIFPGTLAFPQAARHAFVKLPSGRPWRWNTNADSVGSPGLDSNSRACQRRSMRAASSPLPFLRRREPDFPGRPIDVLPPKPENLAAAPAAEIREPDQLIEGHGKVADHHLELGPLEKALPGVPLRQRRELRQICELALIDGQPEGPSEKLRSPD